MANHTLTVRVQVTTEDLKDVLAAALEGGINYWVEKVSVRQSAEGAEYASDVPALGGILGIKEQEGTWHILNQEHLLRGIERAAAEGLCSPGTEDWTVDVDAGVADAIVQFALFGKLVYG